jgi:ATP-dependent DNA helicase RecG
MTLGFFDPVARHVADVLAELAAGEPPRPIERAQVDVKEEPGRRGPGGSVLPGQPENEEAARYLAGEMACFANTPGGGAIILGVADDGQRIGTALEPEWLRHRIWELTGKQLTVSARALDLAGTRVLLLTTHQSLEPIRFAGRLRWRVDDHCVEMDATSWYADRQQRAGVDWSAQPSSHTLDDVSAVALEVARQYLGSAAASGDEAAADLAAASMPDLLRRIHVTDADGRLTNAGALLFVATPDIGIHYIRRDAAGADSTARVRTAAPLIQQLADVEKASEAGNRLVPAPAGFAHGQVRAIPPRALREAIVNGVVHRDWLSRQPTTVEHVGDTVTVTSPGGFIGGIAPSNIITHPSAPRYRSLAEAVATLRLAEREGVGIDRMVRDMLARGHAEPAIAEIPGPYVRVTLVGGDPDSVVMAFLASLAPPTAGRDVDMLLLLHHLIRRGWVDVRAAAPVLQRSPLETDAAITRLAAARGHGVPVIVPVQGVPAGQPPAYRLSDPVRDTLGAKLGHLENAAGRLAMIADWASARGRVSSTEAADLTGLSVPYAGTLLSAMETDGTLRPGRASRMGRGFFFVPARAFG